MAQVLILPGWQNSGPAHWQRLWAERHGDLVVEQDDWWAPRRGDWLARLNEVVMDTPGDLVLAAHSLACIQVAAWARASGQVGRIRGALLVAPGDVERDDLRQQIPGWAPIERARLPFASVLVASRNDPFCDFERARALATAWGSDWVDAGEAGHLNADSGLGDWPEGRALLQRFWKETSPW